MKGTDNARRGARRTQGAAHRRQCEWRALVPSRRCWTACEPASAAVSRSLAIVALSALGVWPCGAAQMPSMAVCTHSLTAPEALRRAAGLRCAAPNRHATHARQRAACDNGRIAAGDTPGQIGGLNCDKRARRARCEGCSVRFDERRIHETCRRMRACRRTNREDPLERRRLVVGAVVQVRLRGRGKASRPLERCMVHAARCRHTHTHTHTHTHNVRQRSRAPLAAQRRRRSESPTAPCAPPARPCSGCVWVHACARVCLCVCACVCVCVCDITHAHK